MYSLVNNCFFYSHADNHPVHLAQEVVDHIYDSGVIIRFLPPCSPDLNPIEEVFAKVKHYSRQNDVVLQSVRVSSPLDCRNSANLNAKAVSFFYSPCTSL